MPRRIEHLHAVILAGGSGQRFWPLSRELKPKQLLDLFGTDSLIVQAVKRVWPLVGAEEDHLEVVCGEMLRDELQNHLLAQADVPRPRFLVEPAARNTAPAIALAAAELVGRDPEAVMIVLPSDHVLDAGQAWEEVVTCAAGMARDGWLVTIGIRPTRPETGYGYIRVGERLEGRAVGCATPHAAEAFVEKPDAETAERYLADGGYLWNAGIFVFRAATLLEALEGVSGEGAAIVAACRRIAEQPAGEWLAPENIDAFSEVPRVPIDTALMEKATKVAVIPADLGWNDVGSLLALEELASADEAGNVLVGRAMDVDSTDTVVYAPDRLVATLGLEGMLVVDTEDATLVCPKSRAQDVRRVVEALKARGDSEVVEPKTSLRPWGSWAVLLEGDGFKIKRIEVHPGARLSLQRHAHRAEHWVVVQGRALVTRDGEQVEVPSNASTFISPGMVHRLENPGDESLVVIEIQVGEYLGEDDIERLEDDWSR